METLDGYCSYIVSFFNLLRDISIIEEKKQQGDKKLSSPEECLKKPLQLKSEKTTSSIMKKRQSTFPLRWMEGRNHASNWKCRRSLHNYQTTKYKDVKDVSNKKNSRDHEFKYNVGKQTLCRNFLQNIYTAGCQIHGGVFQNIVSKLHRAHSLLNFADI